MEHANSLVGTARVGSRTRKCQRERRSSEQRSRNEEADEEADERAAVVVRQRREDSATTATDEGGERPRVTHIEPRRDLNGRSRSLCSSSRLCGRVLSRLHRRDYERLRAWSVGQWRAAGVVEIVLFFA